LADDEGVARENKLILAGWLKLFLQRVKLKRSVSEDKNSVRDWLTLTLIEVCSITLANAAQPTTFKLDCVDVARGGTLTLAGTRYQEGKQDFGFDLQPSPQVSNGACHADAPFFVSVAEPDGDYRVTVELGGPDAALTTVKAEARRLMVEQVATKSGKTAKRTVVVNVRTAEIGADEKVRLKPREIGSLDWDHKLTLEFTGQHPSLRSIEIIPDHVPTVYIAGDSTVVDQDQEPWAAWGQILPVFFNEKIAIANEAESGETIASFVGERRFDKILSTIGSSDFLLMQFAHNDQKPGREFVSIPDYKDLLRRYIKLARDRGAQPMLVTSMNRRTFTPDGKIEATLGDYPEAMRQISREQKVPLVDLNVMSKTLFEALGPEGTLKAFVHYPANTFPNQTNALADNTHFNSYGALELAKCIVQSMRDQHLQLARYLRHSVHHFDPAHPDPVDIWRVPPDPFWSAQTPYER
jgi:lysophospholipase L1-like esterase